MTHPASYSVRPIGFIRSDLKCQAEAPLQGQEGAPDAWLEVDPCFQEGLQDLLPGQEVIIITWLLEAQRDTLKVHPRNDENTPLTGVFSTRSADRPNPLGLHQVTIREIAGNRIRIGPMEAIDGTRLRLSNRFCRHQQTDEFANISQIVHPISFARRFRELRGVGALLKPDDHASRRVQACANRALNVLPVALARAEYVSRAKTRSSAA
jgi:tRNA-Thr(GGU) m(6)t(6)A37 methyltransferase TsaA